MFEMLKESRCVANVLLVTESNMKEVATIIPAKLPTNRKNNLVPQIVWVASNNNRLVFRYLTCINCIQFRFVHNRCV